MIDLGSSGSWNASSEVMMCSAPGNSVGFQGRPPVATSTLSAVIVCLPSTTMVWASVRRALPWMTSAPALLRLVT